MSSDEDVTLILLLVMGGVSALATLAGGFFATRETQCQAAFTPWTTCTDECDTEPTRSRKYVIQSGAEACPYIDGYTETESCGPVQPCCEVEEDWAPEGTCSTTGLQKTTRKLKANKPGGCDGITTEEFDPCCYEEGDWDFVGACGEYETGMQRSKQTTAGCTAGKEYKDEPCAPCQGDWSNEIPESCPGPNECGFGGDVFSKTWNVTVPAIGTGLSCPYEDEYEETLPCPATPSCCVRTAWTPSGQCITEGQKQVRTVTGSDCGEDNATFRFLPCCEYTAWTPSGGCTPNGQKQEREEIENTDGPTCAKEEEQSIERYVPCCGYTEWTPSEQCTPNGQKQVRNVDTTVQGCAPEETEETTEQFMPCCGYSDWETKPSAECTKTPDGTDATLAKIRSIIESTDENPCAKEQTALTTRADPCCHITGGWQELGGCGKDSGLQVYTKNAVGTACQPADRMETRTCTPCEGDWKQTDCPGYCGYKGGTLKKTWVTTEPAEGTGTCPTDEDAPTYNCPATTGCATDCKGGAWDLYQSGFPECDYSLCSTPTVTYSRNWVGAEDATNGGQACPPRETKTCVETEKCYGKKWSYINLDFNNETGQAHRVFGREPGDVDDNNPWDFREELIYLTSPTGRRSGRLTRYFEYTGPYAINEPYKIQRYSLAPGNVRHSPKTWELIGVTEPNGEEVRLHYFALNDRLWNLTYPDKTVSVTGGTVSQYYDTSGYSPTLTYKVECSDLVKNMTLRQFKFRIYDIEPMSCQDMYNPTCRTYYVMTFDTIKA